MAGRLASEKTITALTTKKAKSSAYFLPVLLLFGLTTCTIGCKKIESRRLSPARVHTITRDLARVAESIIQGKGSVQRHLLYIGSDAPATDNISIVLSLEYSETERRQVMARLVQALDHVATTNHLTRGPVMDMGIAMEFRYQSSGMSTHAIFINSPLSSRVPRSSGVELKGQSLSKEPRLAIIIDDLGNDRAAAEAVFALGYPLTISVLPNHEHSVDIAQEAHRRGFQVMLHLPMQSLANETPEAQELRPGMPAPEVVAMVDQFLQNVPGAAGVNNHQGSQATADAALMDELMPVLRDRHLFYVDSRTTAATVAYDTAQDFAVRSAFRNVPFLDDVAQVTAVRKQLKLALRGAREKGEAVAIGHPHPATLQALREVLPQAQAQGVRLVPALELVH